MKDQIDNNLEAESTISNPVDEIKMLSRQLEEARKEAEEYQKLKSTFISNISHEMRTPLNAILGFSELSAFEDITLEDMQEYMSIIRSSSRELLEKILDIIYLSSLDAGEIQLEEDIVSLTGIMNELNEYYSYSSLIPQNESVRFHADFSNTKHIYFRGDAGKIIKALKKIIDNGIRFTQKGSVELSVDLSMKNRICFVVKDTGIGIPDEKKKIIFEPFTTAEDSYNRNYNGSGLGLSTALQLINLMDGEIEIESEMEIGSSFKVSIPYHPIHQKKISGVKINMD